VNDLDEKRAELLSALRQIHTIRWIDDVFGEFTRSARQAMSLMADAFAEVGVAMMATFGDGIRTTDAWNIAAFEYRYARQRQRKARRVKRG
jgi:hypothetical protein